MTLDAPSGVIDDPTFPYRVVFGLLVFGVLGAIDVVRDPADPKRMKEYVFLFSVTATVMLYGLVHDAITFWASPEYFRAVKGLVDPSFFPDVVELALAASWTAGLVIGLGFLVANNPSGRSRQLPYARLLRLLLWPAVLAPLAATGLALSSLAMPTWGASMLGVTALAVDDPGAVATVWAIHIGTYLGAGVGLVVAIVRIRMERWRPAKS